MPNYPSVTTIRTVTTKTKPGSKIERETTTAYELNGAPAEKLTDKEMRQSTVPVTRAAFGDGDRTSLGWFVPLTSGAQEPED